MSRFNESVGGSSVIGCAGRKVLRHTRAWLGLDCHEFSSAPSHAQTCKRLVVAAVARALCAPHRQPLPSSTRRSTLLVRRPSNCRCSAARRGGTAPGRHGHQTTPCRKPWRARVCRSTSRPAHPITELPPILSLNLDMSACLWRARKGMRSGPAPSSLPRGAVAGVAAAPAPPGVCATGRGVAAPPLLLVANIVLFRVQGCEEGLEIRAGGI